MAQTARIRGESLDSLYRHPQSQLLTSSQPVDIVRNTTATSMIWHTPKLDAYPEGTSLYVLLPPNY